MTAILSTNGPNTCHVEAPPTRLLVATLNGVDIVERERVGAPWRVTGHALDGVHPSCLMRPSRESGIFAGVHGGGIFHSADEGATWTPRDAGVTIRHVFSLGHQTHNGETTLYAGTEPVSIFRSCDNGATWSEMPSIGKVPGNEKWTFPPPPHIAHTKSFLFDARDADHFYVAIEQGALLETRDGGATWRELDDFWRPDDVWPKDIHRLTRDPRQPDTIYMASGMGLFVTRDGGSKWTQLTDMQSRVGYPDQIMFAPNNPDIIFASGAERDPRTWRTSHWAKGAVIRSRDGGKTWAEASKGMPSDGRANIEAFNAVVWPGGYMLVAGNTDGQVFVSEDAADSWTLAAEGLRPVSKGGHFRNLQSAA